MDILRYDQRFEEKSAIFVLFFPFFLRTIDYLDGNFDKSMSLLSLLPVIFEHRGYAAIVAYPLWKGSGKANL